MALYALDTSAVSAVLRGEPGFELVEGLLYEARQSQERTILMPFIVLMETEYTSLRYAQRDIVDQWMALVDSWPVEVVESSYSWRRAAAAVKSTYRLSLADAWVAALALLHDAELVHKDPEFDAIAGMKALRLPDDRRARGGT